MQAFADLVYIDLFVQKKKINNTWSDRMTWIAAVAMVTD